MTELAEGARLEIVCSAKSGTEGSNPSLSARRFFWTQINADFQDMELKQSQEGKRQTDFSKRFALSAWICVNLRPIPYPVTGRSVGGRYGVCIFT